MNEELIELVVNILSIIYLIHGLIFIIYVRSKLWSLRFYQYFLFCGNQWKSWYYAASDPIIGYFWYIISYYLFIIEYYLLISLYLSASLSSVFSYRRCYYLLFIFYLLIYYLLIYYIIPAIVSILLKVHDRWRPKEIVKKYASTNQNKS